MKTSGEFFLLKFQQKKIINPILTNVVLNPSHRQNRLQNHRRQNLLYRPRCLVQKTQSALDAG